VFFEDRCLKLTLILNRDAGTLRGQDAEAVAKEIADIFRSSGHSVVPQVVTGDDAITAIRRAAKAPDADALVVGGGDGTISAAAAAAAESGAVLGVLPLGTMNFFARSLAIPAAIKDAAMALATGDVRAVDIASINGRRFVHTISLGIHPTMVEEREKLSYGSRYGKMFGSVRAWFRVIQSPQRFRVVIMTDDTTLELRTPGLVVSNNPLGEGHLPYADRLDTGVLGLYVTPARTWQELLRVTAAAAIGALAASPLVEHHQSATVEISSRHRRSMPVTVDGELLRLDMPMKVAIEPGGLKVLTPRRDR
jgi:diacylglycerol kinase family enzyme